MQGNVKGINLGKHYNNILTMAFYTLDTRQSFYFIFMS